MSPKRKRPRRSLIDWLPAGLQSQPGWMVLSILATVSGLSFMLGISESAAIIKALGGSDTILKVWGLVLLLSGSALGVSVIRGNLPMEKLSHHIMSVSLAVYGGWLTTIVPLAQTGITLVLILAIIGMMQIRTAVIRRVLRLSRHSEVSNDNVQ